MLGVAVLGVAIPAPVPAGAPGVVTAVAPGAGVAGVPGGVPAGVPGEVAAGAVVLSTVSVPVIALVAAS